MAVERHPITGAPSLFGLVALSAAEDANLFFPLEDNAAIRARLTHWCLCGF